MKFLLNLSTCEITVFSKNENEVIAFSLILWVEIKLNVLEVAKDWSIFFSNGGSNWMIQETFNPEITDAFRGVLNCFNVTWNNFELVIICILHLGSSFIEFFDHLFVEVNFGIDELISKGINALVLLFKLNLEFADALLFFLIVIMYIVLDRFQGLESALELIVHTLDV